MADRPALSGRLTTFSSLVGVALFLTCPFVRVADAAPGTPLVRPAAGAAESAPASQDPDAAIAALEASLAVASDPTSLRPKLAEVLVKRALKAAEASSDLEQAQLIQISGDFRRAKELVPGNPAIWLAYLSFLLSRPDQAPIAATEAPAALDTVMLTLPKPLPAGWKNVVERLDTLYAQSDMPLYRVQCLELLAQNGDAGAASASKLLVIARETAKRRSPEVVSRIDAALSLGDLGQAQLLLNGLQRLDPAMPSLPTLQKRLRMARQIDGMVTAAFKAVREGKPAFAREMCEQILRIDPHNPQARTLAARLSPETVASSAASPAGEADRSNAMIQELLIKLDIAVAREDILAARQILREFVTMGLATPPHLVRLQRIEQEILVSRLFVAQRFDEAQSLFEARQWEKLRRLLNRNPALADSTERVIRVWEMALVADYELGWKPLETLTAEADRLAEKAPKSFWPPYVKLMVALKQGRYADADALLTAAQTIEPNSRFLTWPSRILWLWRHGWKFAPLVILGFIYLLARTMHIFFAWWERFYWRWIAIVAWIFPGIALGSLEKRFTAARDNEDKLRLFFLLARCSFATGNAPKGIRYAEQLLEVNPGDPRAVEMLGRQYLSLPNPTPAQFAFVVSYAAGRPNDRGLIEKLGKSVLAGRAITPELLPVLGRYMSLFPEDDQMTRLLVEFYRNADAVGLTGEAIDFIEHAWNRHGTEELWYVLLRALIVRGLYERFEKLVTDAAASGKGGEWWRLFELVDRQIEDGITPMQSSLGAKDKALLTEAMQNVLAMRFVMKKHFQQLALALDGHVMSEDVAIRYHAQKARDHLRSQTMKTEAFLAGMTRLVPDVSTPPAVPVDEPMAGAEAPGAETPEAETPVPDDEFVAAGGPAEPETVSIATSSEPVEPPQQLDETPQMGSEPSQETPGEFGALPGIPAEPSVELPQMPGETAGAAAGESHDDLFADLDRQSSEDIAAAPVQNPEPPAEPMPEPIEPPSGDQPRSDLAPSTMELPPVHEPPVAEPEAGASTVGGRIRELADDAEYGDIQLLVGETGPGDMEYWKEYIERPPSRSVLETLPKLLAARHAPELTPVLARLVGSEHPRVRANAVEALEENGDQEAIPVFITLLRDDDNRVRANALKGMSKFGVDTVLEELRGMIEDPRVEMRDSATYVLKGIRGQDAAVLLERLLRDGSPLVRFNAIRSLAAQGDPGNMQRLMEYLPEVADPEERDLLFKAIAELQKAG
ncbi:MAG TPA: HEAT repeat domain-containing protein [Candidatus Ozemobacteraceae bacterium]|nr:HEAT repeat domain-containing protein [Candidatus Ozemobacteraceae bacterium]